MYDYDRLSDGKPRQLHIRQSMDVITVPAKPVEDSVIHVNDSAANDLVKLIQCQYYQVFKLNVNGEAEIAQDYPFLIMSVVEGSGTVDGQPVKKGAHFILPSGYGTAVFTGDMEMIASTV